MPLGPEKALKGINENKIQEVFANIDSKIPQHPIYNNKLRIVFRDYELTIQEIQKIIDGYEKAGWLRVEYITSQEKGEKPGFAKLILYT